MFQSDFRQSGDGDGENSLGASLLITTTIATRTDAKDFMRAMRAMRLWRRCRCLSIFISLKKGSIGEQPTPPPSPSSSPPYPPCRQEPVPAAADSKQSSHVIDVRSDEGEEEIREEEILPDNRIVQDRDVLRNIVKEKNLNSLKKVGGVEGAVTMLGSDMQVVINNNKSRLLAKV